MSPPNFSRCAQVGIREMGMIKAKDGRVQSARPGAEAAPGEVIGVARLDDVGPDIIK